MAKKIKKYIFLIFALAVAWPLVDFSVGAGQPEHLIRVGIIINKPDFGLSIRGEYKILNAKTDEALYSDEVLRRCDVLAAAKGIRIGDQEFTARHLKIIPQKDASIYVNSRRFRGEIDVIKTASGNLTVINIVDVDDYIKGVLYHEVSHFWPLEALKAQAVAARTYAFYRMKNGKANDYDVTNDIYSQVYGGRTSEHYRTNMAVDRTAGLIITYRGQVLPAYFHATCGGMTEDSSELWKEDLLPLRGVVCNFCLNSPHYSWKRNFRSKDIQDKLNENGYHLGLIKDIKVAERNKSGRIKTLKITDRDGQETKISGKDFRNIIGPNTIRSNNYDIIMKGYYFDMIGKGWGHGVGLCQWGAAQMAKERYRYDEILQFYYPGIKVTSYEAAGF